MCEPVVVFFTKVRNDGKLTTHLGTSESLPPLSHVAQLAHVYPDLSTSAHQSTVRHNTKLHAQLGAFKVDELSPAHTTPNLPCIHVNDRLAISFHRTVRIPDDGGSYPAPKSLGALPLLNVSHFKDKLPTDAIEKGGLVTSLCDNEAMRINFHVYGTGMFLDHPRFAVRVFAGGVNGLSGEPIKADMTTVLKRLNGIKRTQDYLYIRGGRKPAQQWLDGVAVAPGVVRQFVSVPHLSPESIESEATGSRGVGGIQLEIIPQYDRGRFRLLRRDRHPPEPRWDGERIKREYPPPKGFETPSDLGIPIGARLHARERGGLSRERTLLDELDWASTPNKMQRTLELQLWPPPSSAGDFKVTVKCPDPKASEKELCLSVFPETKLGWLKEQAAYAMRIPPEMWTVHSYSHSQPCDSENVTINEANIRRGQVISLVEQMFVGGGTQSQYSPLLDVAAGGKIRQLIVPDEEDPRSWNTDDACLINIHITTSEFFTSVTGFQQPLHPERFDTYLQRNLPFAPDSSGQQARLDYGLSQIKPCKEAQGGARGCEATDTCLSRNLPGYCEHCITNWASYRLRPCNHALCANCIVKDVRLDLYRTPILKKRCMVCSTKALGTERLERESVVPGQASSDRDSFESVVPLLHCSTSRQTAFEDERVLYIEGEHDEGMQVSDVQEGSQMPGAFPEDETYEDDRMCAFM
ncbi:hypothetical protein CONLIGDRAFT_27029 [Coniochaeta ligniaria NRRL 30616]|uniref:RING-type domain-containing protein n=1 Tax=Coniochaeta ligniaria NRRL 30616 TaxID=1408157 RepID=A0A1J7J412_9PEZI|nr:hypothetical protein CONLIGDRAFT_27029 [Coniochaeta ligniaria NRRL 30616]